MNSQQVVARYVHLRFLGCHFDPGRPAEAVPQTVLLLRTRQRPPTDAKHNESECSSALYLHGQDSGKRSSRQVTSITWILRAGSTQRIDTCDFGNRREDIDDGRQLSQFKNRSRLWRSASDGYAAFGFFNLLY